jgi:hypothetical protein
VLLQKEGGWSLAAPRSPDVELQEQVEALLSLARPAWRNLLAASALGHAELSVALHVSPGPQPATQLTRGQIMALAELGAELDIDLFDWEPSPDL